MIKLKECGQCLHLKTPDNFDISPSGIDGLRSICTGCRRANDRERYHAKKVNRKPPLKFKSKWYMPR